MFTKKRGKKEKQRDRACTLLEEVKVGDECAGRTPAHSA